MSNYKVLVCGSREGGDPGLIRKILKDLRDKHGRFTLIHGGAPGVDVMADAIGRNLGLNMQDFPAKWNSYGKAAGYIRNKQMAGEEPDLVLAFPGGKGTQMMVDIALERGIPVRQFVAAPPNNPEAPQRETRS